jgi:hypothetical protein
MVPDVVWKFLGSIVPLLGAAIQLWTSLIQRLRMFRRIRWSIGNLGFTFAVICKCPVYLANTLLIAVVVLALASLGIGVVLNTLDAATVRNLEQRTAWHILVGLFNKSLYILLAYFVLAVVVHFDLIARALLAVFWTIGRFRPILRFKPGYINATWRVIHGEDAPCANINTVMCELVASYAIRTMATNAPELHADRAIHPVGLGADELANMLLVGNVIEGVIHDLPSDAKPPGLQWRSFYATLGEAALDASRPFSPESILAAPARPESFGTRLVDLTRGKDGAVPDEPAIIFATNEIVAAIAARYRGRGSRLAYAAFRRRPSLALAKRRLQDLPRMSGRRAHPMDVPFLKLAVDAGVWPGIDPGPFIYPFSRGLALFLLNTQCIVVASWIEELPFDEEFQRLVAATEDVIVHAVARFVQGARDERINAWAREAFAVEPPMIQMWPLAREVDYFLWQQSRRKDGWKLSRNVDVPATETLNGTEDPAWRIDGNRIVR